MEYNINLVVGDWSDDGHGKTHTVTVKSNFSPQKVQDAYKQGSDNLKLDITDFCDEYEDNLIPFSFLQKLKDNGYDLETLDGYEEGEGLGLWREDYPKIWIFIAKHGNPALVLEQLKPDDINIGGYGLFT